MSILLEMHALLEKATLGPGEKMVFGKIVKTKKGGKMDAKAKWKKGVQRKRKRSMTSKGGGTNAKNYKKEVQRQIDHNLSRGVKKVRGAKESVDVRLANIAAQLRDLLA